MGKLNGTQHLMKAAGIDPENPIGSILEKLGIDPTQFQGMVVALPELFKGMMARQLRMELAVSQLLIDNHRMLQLLEQNALRLPAPIAEVFPVSSDVDDVLDSLQRRQLGEPEPELSNGEEVSAN